ncbi:MAG: TatD family deoxyribonuclease [Betaproteobacteria bacterium]|nr:MAG: TatD family deoxyribonuclease [Betaproteobacteria bacterium]
MRPRFRSRAESSGSARPEAALPRRRGSVSSFRPTIPDSAPASGSRTRWARPFDRRAPTETQEPTVERLVALAAHPKVLAIGETGLDYYRLKEPLHWQRDRFRVHIRAAREAGKPLVVHTRSAPEDTLKILKEERAAEAGGVMHCFTESLAFAREALELGFYISFSGIVTFRNAEALQAIVPHVPIERLLIETDSPYLSPVPYRGKTNEPARVVTVAQKLAELRSQPITAIARATSENFLNLFRPASSESLAAELFPAIEGNRII